MFIRASSSFLVASLSLLGCGGPVDGGEGSEATETLSKGDRPTQEGEKAAAQRGAVRSAPARGGAVAAAEQPCAGIVTADGDTFTVAPSADDTLCIGHALRTAAANGPGAVVRLTAGAFVIGTVEATDFDGVLQGDGPGLTTIRALGGAVCAAPAGAGTPGLLFFRGGFPRVLDLSIENDVAIDCGADQAAPSIVVTGAACGGDAPSQVSSLLSNVEIVGRGLVVRPSESSGCVDAATTGDHAIESSRLVLDFLRNADGTGLVPTTERAVQVRGLVGGSVTIGGACETANELSAQLSIQVGGDAHVDVSHNVLRGVSHQTMLQVDVGALGLPPAVGPVRVARNHLTATGVYVRGIVIGGADATAEVDVVVEANLVAPFGETRGSVAVVGTSSAGIEGGGARGVIVRGNRLTGTMDFGVSVEDGAGWQIVDNDVTALGARYARISLGERSTTAYVESSLALGQYDVKDSGEGNTLVDVVTELDAAGPQCPTAS